MNAPWTPGKGPLGLRDPYAAYVCDDATGEALRSVVEEFGWSVEKINKGGLRNAVQSLSVAASPNILFVDLSEVGDPLNDINALAEVCEPGTVVIALGQVNDVKLYRDLLSSGIQDYLLKPCSPDHIRDALAHAQAVLSAPKHADGANERPHHVTAVIGARGGVGATTIATSIAWLMSTTHDRSTALLDLDIHFGTGALLLDIEPGRGLTDAIDNPSRIDGLFIERAMVKANDKLSILSAEAPISQPVMTDGGALYQLQEEMRGAFECTVIDLPRDMLINHPHLMAEVQTVVLICELTLASARDMIRLLSWLKANAPRATIQVIANRVDPKGATELNRKEFETSIEHPIDIVVPLDPKLMQQAVKVGKPIVDAARGSKVALSIIELVAQIIVTDGDEEGADKAAKKKKSFFSSSKEPKEAKEKK